MNIREITKDELENRYEHHLTVGKLKELIYEYNLPSNAKVLVQRVEDRYYENCEWGVYLKEDENTIKDKDGNVLKETMSQYHPAWYACKYKDEDNALFIDLHY